jgi:hypothetical protein
MNAEVTVRSYSSPDKIGFRVVVADIPTNILSVQHISLPKDFDQWAGGGDFVDIVDWSPDNSICCGGTCFVAFFDHESAQYLLLGRCLISISKESNAINNNPWMGSKRRFSYLEHGRLQFSLTYCAKTKDIFEENDGDIFWWIGEEIRKQSAKTPPPSAEPA